jgi:nitrite reductase (NADH) small subunit
MSSVTEATPELAYSLGPAEQIPMGEGRLFQINDAIIAVFRTRQGKFYATQANCPHKNGPLIDGLVGGGQIVCPLHAYKFDLATGSPVGNDCSALKTYEILVTETGEILLMPEAQSRTNEVDE